MKIKTSKRVTLKTLKNTYSGFAGPNGFAASVAFGNQYKLSIIKHKTSYGGDKGLYEIGVYKNNDMVEMPGITQEGDTVKGFLTEQDVDGIMVKMITVTGSEPQQVFE